MFNAKIPTVTASAAYENQSWVDSTTGITYICKNIGGTYKWVTLTPAVGIATAGVMTTTINGNLTVSGTVQSAGLSTVTTVYYVDKASTSTATPNGSFESPFLKISDALAAMTGSGPYALWIAPNTYSDTGSFSGPSANLTIYGNGSTWNVTGSLTMNGPFYITNLRTVASGTLTYAATGPNESIRIGGSLTITGGIFTTGYEHFFDLSILSNTLITINPGATPVFTNVVGTPRFKTASGCTSATVLTIINSESLASGAYTNVDLSNGGLFIARGYIATNNGSIVNINLVGSSATGYTAANILDGVEAAWTTAGSSFTVINGTDYLPLLTGTNLILTGPLIVANSTKTAQTASIGSTTVLTAGAAGLYRYTGTVRTTTAGTAGTVLITLNGTASTAASLTSTTAQYGVSGFIYLQASETISYTTTVASNSGGQYRVDVVVEQIK